MLFYSLSMDTLLLNQLTRLNDRLISGDFSRADLTQLIMFLQHPDGQVVIRVAPMICGLSYEDILGVLRCFPALPTLTKYALLPFLVAMEFHEPYGVILDQLLVETDDRLVTFMIGCLGKAEYPILPVLMPYLDTEDYYKLHRYKLVLKMMGFERIRPFLSALPVLVYEQIFRDVFGDSAINELRYGVS